jgi:hypothetical protein
MPLFSHLALGKMPNIIFDYLLRIFNTTHNFTTADL